MAKTTVVLEAEIHEALLTDRRAQERAAEEAIRRAMKEDGLTRKEAREIYGVQTKARRQI